MRTLSIILLIFWTFPLQAQVDYVEYVNPLIGTDSRFEFSNGNTYPAIARPFGMNFWTPQTNDKGNGWIYQYSALKIRGFRQTHQPSPWIGDYGTFSLFATTEKLVFNEKERESWYSHKAETVKPYYYKAYLADYNTSVEITPTERAACFRINFPKTEKAYLVIDGYFKGSFVKVIPEERKIIGYAKNSSGGTPENFKNYFVIYVDKDFEEVFLIKDGVIGKDALEATSEHSGAILRFNTDGDETVNVKVASSFISHEQAELNLQREIGDKSFEQVKEEGKAVWNQELGKIAVEGGTPAQFTTFYTALYRTLLFPRKFFEYDEHNRLIHYSPYNGQVLDGYMFTDNGFWDTFRAVFPFFTLFYPELNAQIMEGLANAYRESGWLPEWASPGHRDCMIGSNSAILIADAYLKGISIPSIEVLYEAMVKNAANEGPLTSVGRYGVDYYNRLGYVPYDVDKKENTARTLEYAFADYNIWQLAKVLKRPQAEVDTFAKRALYYQNVFDPSTNFMRGRNADGSFQSPFRADKWGDAFTEGCSWHWTWCVFHDVQGLINLMGGQETFAKKLDAVFTTAPTFDYSYYGFQIHEITEMLVVNMGQYAHGNQPIQHMPYLYNYAGQPWKSQYHVRNIMDKLYTAGPDGLCGDEDNGQTSAWYVFSAIGMYPVASGTGEYVLGSPLFKKTTLQLPDGKQFTINAPDNNATNVYIEEAQLNKERYSRNFLKHEDILRGGTFDLKMRAKPNRERGIDPKDSPYSMSKLK